MATTVSHQVPSVQAHTLADLGFEDAATLHWQTACVQSANTLTALPHGRYVNVRMERMRQGLELAQRGAVTLPDDGAQLSAVVRSGNNIYQIDMRLLTCTCGDYQKHLQACKHLLATEIHIGALGLAAPTVPVGTPVPDQAAAADPDAVAEVVTTATMPEKCAPTTATWPISEAPASLNIKLRVGNMELMYTMRDTCDLKLQRRATMSLPWLTDILHGCEANLAARQQAEEEKKVQARSLDEQIAAAVAAALKAQGSRSARSDAASTSNGQHPPIDPPLLEPTNDTDPSWCPIHRCKMERRTNERGSWFSHRLSNGSGYCKGE